MSIPFTTVFPVRQRAVENPRGYDYLVSLPPSPPPARGWPLILFLHGTGERGANVADVARQGLPKLLSGAPDLSATERAIAAELTAGFIVVSPQCASMEVWDEPSLLRLCDQLRGTLPIDAARVHLTGLSMGGFGAWSLGLRHPERFATLVPVCGGGRILDLHAPGRGDALRALGVWAFHGAKDRVVPVEESRRMIDALEKLGATDVNFTVYPDVEHDSWTPAYATPELYAWLRRHARPT